MALKHMRGRLPKPTPLNAAGTKSPATWRGLPSSYCSASSVLLALLAATTLLATLPGAILLLLTRLLTGLIALLLLA
jgi:hypothetical protein